MRVVIYFKKIEDKEKIINLIAELIQDKVVDLYLVIDGQDEEVCNRFISTLSGVTDRKQIKTFNWYPEIANGDKEVFLEWFFAQFKADELYIYNGELCPIQQKSIFEIDYITIIGEPQNDKYVRLVAKSIADSKLFAEKNHIYVDLSDVVNTDFVTGIQRVCYALVDNMKKILSASEKYEVCPVYSCPGENLFIKCKTINGKYKKCISVQTEDIVQFADADFLVMPDISIMNVSTKVSYLKRLHNRGIGVYTLLHDIIPIRHPEYYSPDHVAVFTEYAKAISCFSGFIANSLATKNDYLNWINEEDIQLKEGYLAEYFHLGCDIENSNPSKLKKGENIELVDNFKNRETFLMVATIEPRKMHQQVLRAFELLWSEGKNINLVFVGKYGWQMEGFVTYVNKHKENGKRLFWMQGVSDEYLDRLYEASTAVIVASTIEGFGLPIIEASKHKKYLILRDIPVFREIAGENAFYFDSFEPEGLSESINKWIDKYISGELISDSSKININSWEEATNTFLNILGIDV